MQFDLLKHIQHKTSRLAFGSALYHWSLRGDVPDRLIVRPVDPWQGDAEAGARLYEGVFRFGEDELAICADTWEPDGVDAAWLTHMHGFTWLRDLRALANQSGRGKGHRDACQGFARQMILAWVDRYYGWRAFPWRPDVMGERLSMWIALYEFFGDEDDFDDLFFDSLIRQARHLSRLMQGGEIRLDDTKDGGLSVFRAAKGLLYAGVSLEGYEGWIEQGLKVLLDAIDTQILGDGAHISRNAGVLASVLQILLDVRGALATAGYPAPEEIQHAIDKAGQALRFFRYNDKGFGVFNGVQEGDCELIDAVLAQSGTKGRVMQSLPCAGYERVSMGRSLIMFDCATPPVSPYDTVCHAAPLAFEMSYAKERVFVNCGTHPSDAMWRDSLRGTAAHNTLTIDHRNACEIIGHGGFGRKTNSIHVTREENKDGCLLEASHDGYVALSGMEHKRRLYVSGSGHDIRGEDSLISPLIPVKPHDVAVRFHLHPAVKVSLINKGEEALLRLPSGIGWRFKHGGGVLALEDSLYLGQGVKPRKTKQLVIYGQVADSKASLKWAVLKEG